MSDNTRTFPLYIFDLDGTLIDSFEDIAAAVNATLQAMGAETLSPAQIKQDVGQGARWLLARCLERVGLDPAADLATARDHFLPLYTAGLATNTRPYPAVVEVLSSLHSRGSQLALCTNKPIQLTLPLLAQLDLSHWFSMVLGGDSLPEKKPNPAPLFHILRELGVAPSDALMVGDSQYDIEAGQAAGVATCGVTYGHHDRQHMQALAPDWTIDHITEMLTLTSPRD